MKLESIVDSDDSMQEYAQLVLNLSENYLSIYDVDIDTGKYTLSVRETLKDVNIQNDFPMTDNFFTNNDIIIPYTIYKDDQALVTNTLNKGSLLDKLSKTPAFSIDYRFMMPSGPVWYKMKIVRKGDWKKERRMVVGIFDNSRNMRIEEENTVYAGIANALSEVFESIYYVNLDDNSFVEYSKRDTYATLGIEIKGENFFEESRKNCKHVVFPDDYEKVCEFIDRDYIMECVEKSVEPQMEYRLLDNGKALYYRMRIIQAKNDDRHIIVAVENVDVQVRARMNRREQYVQMLTISNYLIQSFKFVYYAGFREDYVVLMYVGKDDMNNAGISEQRMVVNGEYASFIDKYVNIFVVPEERKTITEYLSEKYIRERFRSENGFSFVFHSKAYGEDRIFRAHVAKGVDDEHVALGFIDITEETRKELEQQRNLEEALVMAQAANRAKTTFLSNMSHDIRTPMNAIIGFTDLAASHIDNKEQVQNYLNKIAQSSNHLLSLINDVLDMSRIESGKMHLVEKDESLSDIIHTLRNIVLPEINQKKMQFFIDARDITDENIVCDRLRLNQVLINTLSNAIKYTHEGGSVSLRIVQKEAKRSGYASYEFRIQDNGIGMEAEFLKKIYDPFTRVSNSTVSGIQGTGLGMAITKNIVDMMGGTISITSTPGRGTEVVMHFEFRLQSGAENDAPTVSANGKRGLIVDDDSVSCVSVSKMLDDVGIRSDWSPSGQKAVEMIAKAAEEGDPYQLFIVDWLMPGMDGIETAGKIRRLVGEKAPIIIYTAYDWSDIEQEARAAGVNGFLSKPLFPSDVRRTLSNFYHIDVPAEKEPEDRFDFTGWKIMLVEDNELNREIAAMILEEVGFTVEEVEDGCYAVEKMQNFKNGDYDLILMDIQMPIMNGYEATKRIRALENKEAASIPILAMTANAFEEDRQNAFEAGMNEHIAKPINKKELMRVLNKVLVKN